MIIRKQNINEKQNCVIQTLMVLLVILKQKIFAKMFLMMLINDFTHEIMNSVDHYPFEKTRKRLN